jgi:RNA polymerase sigma factor (TIGR02999 family)
LSGKSTELNRPGGLVLSARTFSADELATKPSGDITEGLVALRRGEPGALDRLVPLLYDDLRRLARQRLRKERDGHTLDTTGLVHEAYLRLATQRQLAPSDRAEFFAAASNTMRRILVDYARARRREKRGGGRVAVPVEEAEPFLTEPAVDEALALDVALARLEAVQPRAARVFEQRFFGGLAVEEIALAQGVSTKTVQRDWDAARAWLRKEVSQGVAADADCPGDGG